MGKFQISERLKENDDFYHNGVYYDEEAKMAIASVTNWSNTFYFKVYDLSKIIPPEDPNEFDRYEMCRISMIEPKYIGEPDETIKLNESQVIWLEKALRTMQSSLLDPNFIYNTWEYIIMETNMEHEIIGDIDQYRCPNLPIPDYSKLIKEN